MKTTEEYLEEYDQKRNQLIEKGELWRLRVSREEFIAEIERIRTYGANARKEGKLTEYHIQKNERGGITNMLMSNMTREEFINQSKKLKEFRRANEKKDSKSMKRHFRIAIFIAVFIVLVLLLTNPSKADFEEFFWS